MSILFPYQPIGPIAERWGWVTNVFTAKDGTETRRAIREVPREMWEWTVFVEDGVFNALVRGRHSLTWLVPAWHQAEKTTGVISPGASTVVVDTDVGDWRTTIMLWSSPTNNETIGISSVGSDIINLSTTVVNTYPAGSFVVPVRTARLANPIQKRDDKTRSLLQLSWLITDATALTGYDWTTQYDSTDVVTDKYLISGEWVDRTLQAAVEEYDFDSGVVAFEVQYDPDVWAMPTMAHRAATPAEYWQWLTWFHKLQGRFGEFWLPTWKKEITLTASFTDSDRWLTIENIGYVDYLDGLTSNRMIYFERHPPHAPELRYIIESAAVDSDTEQIRLDSNLGFAGNQKSFLGVHWCQPCRLEADQVELIHEPGLGTAIAVPVRERVVPATFYEETDPDPAEYKVALYVATTGTYADDYYTIITDDLGFQCEIFADGTLPTVGQEDFDVIFAQGFGASQAANAVTLLAYEASGVPVLIGCSSGDLASNFGTLIAEMGIASNSNSNSTFNVDPSFQQTAGSEILNGTEQDAETLEWSTITRIGLPLAITTRANAYGKKDYIWDDASPIGTTLAWARIPTDSPGNRRGIGLISIDQGQDGFTSRCVFSGHLQTTDVVNMGDDAKTLLGNILKWLLLDFESFSPIPQTYSGVSAFHLGKTGSKFYRTGNMTDTYLNGNVDPPNTYSNNGLRLTAGDLCMYSVGTTTGDWEFHCQWIYRDGASNQRVGFGFNCEINHTTVGGTDILDGYVWSLDNVDGNLYRFWAEEDPPASDEWVQRITQISSTSQDWDSDILFNTQMSYVGGLWQIRGWNEGTQAPPAPFGGGGTSLTLHTQGRIGPFIELGNVTARMEISFYKVS